MTSLFLGKIGGNKNKGSFIGLEFAGTSMVLLLMSIRLLGPLNLILLDEFLAQLFPSLRSATRSARVRVYNFRVRNDGGRQSACLLRLLRGDLRGAAPMQEDLVRLVGTYSCGVFPVRRGCNQSTGSVIAPCLSHSGWILNGTFGIAVLLGFYIDGVLDP